MIHLCLLMISNENQIVDLFVPDKNNQLFVYAYGIGLVETKFCRFL